MIRAFISAPTPAMRAGLRAMLEGSVLVVAEGSHFAPSDPVADGLELLVASGESWAEDAAHAAALNPQPAVLILSDDQRVLPTLRALGLPGWGTAPPNAEAEQVIAAAIAVTEGFIVIPPERLGGLDQRPAAPSSQSATQLQESLTPRELAVLQLLSQGLSNKLIARTLQISEHTVKFHISSTYAKLDATSRTEAVSHAARRGLITL